MDNEDFSKKTDEQLVNELTRSVDELDHIIDDAAEKRSRYYSQFDELHNRMNFDAIKAGVAELTKRLLERKT